MNVIPTSVFLAPGASTTVDVSVDIPPAAMGGTLNETVVRAVSQSNNVIIDVSMLDITMAESEVRIYLPLVMR